MNTFQLDASGKLQPHIPMDAFSHPTNHLWGSRGGFMPKKENFNFASVLVFAKRPEIHAIQWECEGVVWTPRPEWRKALFILEPGKVHRMHLQGHPGWTISIAPSGNLRLATSSTAEIFHEPDRAKPSDPPQVQALFDWDFYGEVGESSRALSDHLVRKPMGLPPSNGKGFLKNHPLDPSDLWRCVKFFQAVPQVQKDLGLMSMVSPEWAAVVKHWDTWTALLEKEKDAGSAPETYAAMKEAFAEVQAAQDKHRFKLG